jgi:predicted phosphodiesterase
MKILVVSDIHYAAEGEQARRGHEARAIRNPLLRGAARAWRHWIWLRDPLAHNHRLGRIIEANPRPDWVVANGDYTVDSAFVGVGDAPAYASAQAALGLLRSAYGDRLDLNMGDHELGKKSLFGGAGGLRLASWQRSVEGLGLPPVWTRELGNLLLVGAASTPLALPVFLPDAPAEEHAAWRRIADEVRGRVASAFDALKPQQRVVLFVHDPSALPFLGREPAIRDRLAQVALTVVGHLHTPAVFRLGSALAGFPPLRFCGHTVRRYSTALREARWWREFRTVLCPSPTGIELLKDGGWLELEVSPERGKVVSCRRRSLEW